MTILHKIRTSFSTQLSLWVAGFVLAISSLVIALLTIFSEDVIHDETIDATIQALENTALRIDNSLRQTEMMARLENQQLRINRSRIEKLIEESGSLAMLQNSLPNVQLYVIRCDSSQFDAYITGGTGGYRQVMSDNQDIYIFTQPLGNRVYSLAAVCPAQDIYGKYARMQWILLSWSIVTIIVLLYILYIVIARHLRPLHRLADAAQTIAQGNLDTPIPDTHHRDETGRLQNSLSRMQQALKAYMTEMKRKQAKLNRQHAQLQATYDEAEAYEKKKANFLRNMTQRMAPHVDDLRQTTDTLCRDYPQLSKTDMDSLQTDIMQGSESIIQLLDQLIQDPAGS
ncbi:HAMP domain-containing protein [uncultured Prevotella sp.]|uniref:sensor histidine kinase n=1 Tax=uncultured Prevotella sp. TaxID=159272 RepID=UPI0025EEE761|nr:HAMP domain-containing protein [uncultured Prevotella sp.]